MIPASHLPMFQQVLVIILTLAIFRLRLASGRHNHRLESYMLSRTLRSFPVPLSETISCSSKIYTPV